MLTCKFHKNPIIYSMEYKDEILKLDFIKPGNKLQRRVYRSVPTNIVYKLFYHKSGTEAISTFTNLIKNQYKILEIITK